MKCNLWTNGWILVGQNPVVGRRCLHPFHPSHSHTLSPILHCSKSPLVLLFHCCHWLASQHHQCSCWDLKWHLLGWIWTYFVAFYQDRWPLHLYCVHIHWFQSCQWYSLSVLCHCFHTEPLTSEWVHFPHQSMLSLLGFPSLYSM